MKLVFHDLGEGACVGGRNSRKTKTKTALDTSNLGQESLDDGFERNDTGKHERDGRGERRFK